MNVELHEIQPGWEVYETGGQRVGDVVGVESGTVHVQTGGLFAKDLYIPPTAIAELEDHRVELNVARDELKGSAWETPPS
jgi:hypothetical protein